MKYGRLTFIEDAPKRNGSLMWKMQCDCGKVVVTYKTHVLRGSTQSCGCLLREHTSRMGKKFGGMNQNNPTFLAAVTKHGHCTDKYSSRESLTHATWRSMKERCSNPKRKDYSIYGGRGITICERWLHSFENFLADMGERPSSEYSIDRINNDGNYEPDNCQWILKSENSSKSLTALHKRNNDS